MQSNHPRGRHRGGHARKTQPNINPGASTTINETWGSQNSLDRPGARTPEEVFFDLQEPTQLENSNEGTQHSCNNTFRMPQSLHGDNIDPSLMDWQSFQLASQVPQVYNSQHHGAQYSFGGSYPPSLQSNDGSCFPGENYLPSSHSHNPIYPQQIAAYDQTNGGYPSTGGPYFQHQIQTFQQPFPFQPALPGGTALSAFPPLVMVPEQQLPSFVQPQQHSQTHNRLSGQWGAAHRHALPPRQRPQNCDNSQQLVSQPSSKPSATRTPTPNAGNYGYVPVNPRFGDLYRPKQRDNMGNPTTWEHIISKEEYTHDELQVIHDGIEVWAYLHTHPEIRRLGAGH